LSTAGAQSELSVHSLFINPDGITSRPGSVTVHFFRKLKMALHNSPIVVNVANFPADMATKLKARPTMLCDETPDVVKEVAKTLVRKGHRADVLELSEGAGLNAQVRAALRAACFKHGTVH
jgi:hypothetical protein